MSKTSNRELLERGRALKGGKAKKIPNAKGVLPKAKAAPHQVKPKVRYKFSKEVIGMPMEKVLKLNEICSRDKKPIGCFTIANTNRKKSMF